MGLYCLRSRSLKVNLSPRKSPPIIQHSLSRFWHKMNKKYSTRTVGSLYTKDFKVYLEDDMGNAISFFHDVPLHAQKEKNIFNMVVEIPRWTNAKLEISKEKMLNPIHQDVSKGKVRFVKNVFPFCGYIWNYGAFPQTWEDPITTDPFTQILGDNDPLDVLEIGSAKSHVGEIKQVKVLGALALIDEGEADWKIFVIDINDPMADKVNDHLDIEKYFPGLLEATKTWFRVYKIPEGKPENVLAFDGKILDKETALKIIDKCSATWEKLIKGEIDASADNYTICTTNVTVKDSKYKVSTSSPEISSIPKQNILDPAPLPSDISHWYYHKSSSS